MQIISTGQAFGDVLKRCIRKHQHLSFATAWASGGTNIFELLLKNKRKIHRSVIGIHFHQTDPDVLDAFIGNQNVKFHWQPSGVFHPKVYLFWTDRHWEMVLGSANLTRGALSINQELMIHISSADCNVNNSIRIDVQENIDNWWENGHIMTREKSETYRKFWRFNKPRRDKLSGEYSSPNAKPPIESQLMAMDWREYYKRVIEDDTHNPQERIAILNYARTAFEGLPYRDMDEDWRKAIAGTIHNFRNLDWGWFGTNKQGKFLPKIIKDNNKHISNALDLIPIKGTVTREDYIAYKDEFLKAFSGMGDGIAFVTRFLAMKRPDHFVGLNKKNKAALCDRYGIPRLGIKEYERYWDDIIERIRGSLWWNSPLPSVRAEQAIWNARAAMLDAICYDQNA